MNKNFPLTLATFTLLLAACASNSLTPASGSDGNSSANTLPIQTKLILGTIKLEETNYAVTAEQAIELLPMFYVLHSLNESEAAAQEEIDGLVNQIRETLTDDQLQAIDAMSLSMQDMFAIVRGNSADSSSSDASSTSSAAGGGAGGPPDMPAGGFPGGEIPGMAPSGTTSTSSSDTVVQIPSTISTPSALFEAVIELLQKKVQ